jgi:hypothetical protein
MVWLPGCGSCSSGCCFKRCGCLRAASAGAGSAGSRGCDFELRFGCVCGGVEAAQGVRTPMMRMAVRRFGACDDDCDNWL